MTSVTEPLSASPSLPGLEHLRDRVPNWEAAVRTLSLTAAVLVESAAAVAAGSPLEGTWQADQELLPHDGTHRPPKAPRPLKAPARVAAPPPLRLLLHPAPPLLTVPAPSEQPRLKPGRVFIVANLQGAYYTLLELLSRFRFDFRTDNLMHLGNLMTPPSPSSATAAAAAGGGGSGNGGSAATAPLPRRFRNSASVLKLVRRHGGLGPMGANECLLLAAARANRERAAAAAAAAAEARVRELGAPLGSFRPGALSLQLAAAALAAHSARGVERPPVPARPVAVWLRLPSCSSDGDDSSGGGISDSSSDNEEREEADMEMVAAPTTPHREEAPPSVFASTAPAQAKPFSGGGGCPFLDDSDLAHLLGMPTNLVLESYGIVLQHAGPSDCEVVHAVVTAAAAGCRRYHILFSHRRPGGASGGGDSGGGATVTGLALCRTDVVRFAVLPPLQTLQCRSPGFGAKLASGEAPSRQDLMLEVLEEPVSELDS